MPSDSGVLPYRVRRNGATACDRGLHAAPVLPYNLAMKLRTFLAALLTVWLAIAPVANTWAAAKATPCESMGSMNQPLPPADDCCDGAMDASVCLKACATAAPVALAPALHMLGTETVGSAVPPLSVQYATMLAPPDIAPPKRSVS